MVIQILEVETGEMVMGLIELASWRDMPLKKNKWQFPWRTLFKTEGAKFYKLTLKNSPETIETIEGMLMLSLKNEEMLFMNNIEVAPHNLGSNGKYDYVAGCLIAYGCMKSFELGLNSYRGYLTFESKTKLISFYQKKYGAVLAMGQKMYFGPKKGIELIKKYLPATVLGLIN